jgi:hypothetical protein
VFIASVASNDASVLGERGRLTALEAKRNTVVFIFDLVGIAVFDEATSTT